MTNSSFKEPVEAPRKDPNVPAAMPWFNMLGHWNVEIASLYGRRLQEWSTIPLRLMNCWSMDDLLDEHEQFSQRLMSDYRTAAGKLAHSLDSAAAVSKVDPAELYAATLLKAQEDAARILDQAKSQARQIIESVEARSEAPGTKPDSAKAA